MSVIIEEVELISVVKIKTEDSIIYMDGPRELFREDRQVHSAVVKPAMTPESQKLKKEQDAIDSVMNVDTILGRHKSKDDEMPEEQL